MFNREAPDRRSKGHSRESGPAGSQLLCWQLLLLLFTVSVSFYTFIHRNFIFSVSTAQLKLIKFNFLTVNFLLNNLLDNCNLYSNLLKGDTCPKCEEDWELHGGKCYYFSTRDSSWNQSRDDCRRGGGDLVKIDSREEQVENTMNDDYDVFWIGLTDSQEEDKWLWVDDSPLNTSFLFWKDSEPDNWAGINGENLPEGEDCVLMEKKSGADDLKCWTDVACIILFSKSICEKPAETGRVTCV
uniref:C-type lectin domain-containing protein n=1 Tax=Anabas testudineus TaxID=64144 RepID=A0A3Q1H514_ANATE